MSTRQVMRWVICALSLSTLSQAVATVTLPRVLSSHMVLQRDMPVPIWGTADAGETVTVTFRNQKKTAAADASGKWMVRLDSLALGAPTSLTVAGTNTLTLTDVLVGEVWIGAGQSNIETDVPDYLQYDPVLAEAAKKDCPNLRLYRSDAGSGWQETKPAALHRYSAQLFYYGYKLQESLGVPVGVMEGALRGSSSGPWLSQEAFKSDPDIQKACAALDAKNPLEPRMQKYNEALTKWQQDLATAKAAVPPVPNDKLPREPKKPVLFGDQKTGDLYEKHIHPMIPYAIRGVLWDQGEGGTSVDQIWQPMIMKALIHAWRVAWGQNEFPWLYVQKPSGGGCALNPEDPINKGCDLFSPLPKDPPGTDYHSSLHQEALAIMQNPNTFLVITTDLGTGVHPHNKSGYATRDTQVALGGVYGKPVEYYGPKFESCKAEGGKIRVSYTHSGRGLTIPAGQTLQGFYLAGKDKKFHWADAVIEGQTVVVSSAEVPSPAAIRYAWGWPLAWANLFNKDGLPAIGFSKEVQ